MRSEIVDLCCHREVLTGNRCNLLVVDRLKHRFFPTRATRSEDVRSAIEEMCRILDIKPPVWCHGEDVTSGCDLTSIPVGGKQVADLVSRLTETEKS